MNGGEEGIVFEKEFRKGVEVRDDRVGGGEGMVRIVGMEVNVVDRVKVLKVMAGGI